MSVRAPASAIGDAVFNPFGGNSELDITPLTKKSILSNTQTVANMPIE